MEMEAGLSSLEGELVKPANFFDLIKQLRGINQLGLGDHPFCEKVEKLVSSFGQDMTPTLRGVLKIGTEAWFLKNQLAHPKKLWGRSGRDINIIEHETGSLPKDLNMTFGGGIFSTEADMRPIIEFFIENGLVDNAEVYQFDHYYGKGVPELKRFGDFLEGFFRELIKASPEKVLMSVNHSCAGVLSELILAKIKREDPSVLVSNISIASPFRPEETGGFTMLSNLIGRVEEAVGITLSEASDVRFPRFRLHGDNDPTVSRDSAKLCKKERIHCSIPKSRHTLDTYVQNLESLIREMRVLLRAASMYAHNMPTDK